ncbi:transmembrane protein 53-B-like [Rhopilema esculentum]|uniref:transmembrane protein 53-B-like n=1 Tax=Rhopilema esculentum TaxID=499914 RepID=UPI0031DACFA6|eukprot:gene3491-1873_t
MAFNGLKQLFARRHAYPCKEYFRYNEQSRHFGISLRAVRKKIKVHQHQDCTKKSGQKPLCVILGWGNSKQGHLSKYKEIFEQKGFSTMTVTPHLADILVFPESRGKKISEEVLRIMLREFGAEKIPVVFYLFSNGGCGLYYFICNELCKKNSNYHSKINVIGSVFDSCPVVPSKESISLSQKAFTQDIKSPVLKAFVWYGIRLISIPLVWLNPVVRSFMDGLKNSPIVSPQLFLYSKNDQLAPHEDITDFIAYRKSCGVPVSAKLWENTPHVAHMKYDQENYVMVLEEFIKSLKH